MEAGRNVGNCLPVDTESYPTADCILVCASVLPIAMQLAAAHYACQTTEFGSPTDVATIGDVRKWKCLFVNDSECKRPINAATEYFNPSQNVTDVSLCLGIVLKSNDVSVGQMSFI
jgi:hypothetical protein